MERAEQEIRLNRSEMKKVELIFVPAPGVGHLVSTGEFAKRLIHFDHRISVTILSMKWFPGFADAYTESLAACEPDRIHIMHLPQVDLPSLDLYKLSPEAFFYEAIQNYFVPVRNAVRDIMSMTSTLDPDSGSVRVAGLVLDLFCSPMVDIATELGLPSYIYLTTNAAFFGLMLYLSTRHLQNSSVFEYPKPETGNTDLEHLIPGFVNPVPSRVLPSFVFNKDGGYNALVKIAEKFGLANGIIVNTFEELETYAVNCFYNGQNPPIYPVGPVIHLNSLSHPELDQVQRDKIRKWLDNQPESSVVYLCFGSMGSHVPLQAKEIALGLEKSERRFLWSFHMPPPQNDAAGTVHYKNPEEMLPQGFMERIQEKGMICGWAPQLEVLGHRAVGGFVSHCGWNSILESLWCGVPIVTWPMHAEQQLNAYMMKEMGLAVVMKLDFRGGTSEVVTAKEIEEGVRQIMDAGSEVRKKVKEIAGMARKAVTEGGSSFNSIGRFIEDMIGNT
ncbi:putative Glycosyltransferase [Hibiscus syriacus]|uniref:Glycosyltransferase n=1 Tax=Hibiscus syriacus TaxID=106335 RepID=A0A6A2YTV6_HIBSY|nr:UDP-glycosyltransferase 71K1-like [Hibiscus syriacus]KAE8682515.1 putative Glycosyltransferase [Hibiscus syriacus]